jgi:hypothetical protein
MKPMPQMPHNATVAEMLAHRDELIAWMKEPPAVDVYGAFKAGLAMAFTGDCYAGSVEWSLKEGLALLAALDARDARIATMEGLLRRYRHELPSGHQPHMICHEVDAVLDELSK